MHTFARFVGDSQYEIYLGSVAKISSSPLVEQSGISQKVADTKMEPKAPEGSEEDEDGSPTIEFPPIGELGILGSLLIETRPCLGYSEIGELLAIQCIYPRDTGDFLSGAELEMDEDEFYSASEGECSDNEDNKALTSSKVLRKRLERGRLVVAHPGVAQVVLVERRPPSGLGLEVYGAVTRDSVMNDKFRPILSTDEDAINTW